MKIPRIPSLRQFARFDIAAAFIVGGLIFGIIGWFTPPPQLVQRYTGAVLLQSSNVNGYKFIDPLLACEIGAEQTFTDLNPLRESIEKVTTASEATGNASRVSVYYRSLNTAHWFSVNPQQTYAPASLLKLFVMMAYYKESRDRNDPSILTRTVPFKGTANPVVDDSPGANIPHLVSGQQYSIQDIIKQMIVYSDNDALTTLTDNFSPQTTSSLNEIFSDLRISSPLTNEKDYYMSVSQYAMAFRVLYSSTYLSRGLSEQALELLSQAEYRSALVAGVPAGTPVAHKFGITTIQRAGSLGEEHQLHDCGIVYYPKHPYLLCVMTAGSDFVQLNKTIAAVSAAAYEGTRNLYR